VKRSLRLKRILSGTMTWLTMMLGQTAFAQEQPAQTTAAAPSAAANELGLNEVVRSIEQRFPSILAAEQDRLAAEGDRLAAAGGFDPSWRSSGAAIPVGGYPSGRFDTVVEQPLPFWGSSIFAGYRLGLGDFPVYDGKLATNQYGEVRAGARVNLLRDGPIDRRRANIRRTEIGVDVAARTVDQQRIDAVRLGSFRYWDWVGSGRKVELSRAWLDLARTRDVGLGRRVETGDLADMERLDNQRAILQRTAHLVSAQRALEQAAIELSMYLRDERGNAVLPQPQRLPGQLLEPSAFDATRLAEAERTALAQRPDLKRLEHQRDQAEVEQQLATNQRRPAIDIVIMGAKDLGPGDPKQDKPMLEAGVMIDIPLLNRTANGRAQAASAQVGRIDAQAKLLRDRVVADVRDAVSALVAASERVKTIRAEVDMAQLLAAQEAKRLDLGEGNVLLVNLREQAALDASLRYVDAVVDWHKAMAAYRAATATPAPK
jgi:outer membrane protein, heavy metal efflux system